jgi:hypothetical protein
MRWLAVAVIVLGAGVAGASPRATDADARARLETARGEIRAHMHALRYAEARDAAKAALAIGAAGRDEVAELARTLGETSAALDDAVEAERWFVLWLSLVPHGDLPAGSSPKLTAPLAAARARAGPLTDSIVDNPTSIVIKVRGDPDQRVAALEVTVTDVRGARSTRAVPLAATPGPIGAMEWRTIELPKTSVATVELSVRDAYGNELLHALGAAGPTEPRRTFRVVKRAPLWLRPWPYLVGAAVTAGLGGVFAWRRSVAKDDLAAILADSENHTFAEAESARARAERHGWLSLTSFATAGVLAAAAVLMFTRGDTHTVVVAPQHDGASVLVTSEF